MKDLKYQMSWKEALHLFIRVDLLLRPLRRLLLFFATLSLSHQARQNIVSYVSCIKLDEKSMFLRSEKLKIISILCIYLLKL